ncbi:MAG: ATPase, AFG1 family [uncultured Thiotrichaceae bacterium]|uniref:ATPase, AFG1 family n=1 Tax=uncultured Thiotrichaceae bacterium TaxID=298394 RepID=A0A6S6UFU4_9GAMM|nr:MAG: ATPase, AFG1 family [uncultured Thiotrichaceae bacterium]
MSIREIFQQKIVEGLIEPDPIQAQAVELLFEVQQFLEAGEADDETEPVVIVENKRGFFERLFGISSGPELVLHKSMYLWGGVGRGKTWLMDQFYNSVNMEKKRRYHFNRFMLDLHCALKQHPEQEDPLEVIAQEWAKKMRLLCVDEVHLTEVANAVLLYPVLEHLMNLGVMIVTTSNRHPAELYQGSIQAERFHKSTKFLMSHMHVINLDNGIDYRRWRTEHVFGNSLSIFARQEADMKQCFEQLGKGTVIDKHCLNIYDREVQAWKTCDNIVWFDFVELCETARTTRDYIWLTEHYQVVMISGVPVMDDDRDQAARRFFYLVDELYDRRVRFIFSADVALDQLYQGHRLQFAFKRTLSRLLAMHTANRLTC